MEELSLDDLFFDGSTNTARSLDKENIKSWLRTPVPCIDDIPQTPDLQKEIENQPAVTMRTQKKFMPLLNKVTAVENKTPGPYATQHGIHSNTKLTPNTGNTSTENVTLTYPWFSCGDNEAPGTDFLPPEQNLLQSQHINDRSSMLRKSLFKQCRFNESQISTSSSMTTEKACKKEVTSSVHEDLFVSGEKNEAPELCHTADEEIFSFRSSLALLTGKGETQCEVLRPVSEIPKPFRSIFKEFPFFNYIQSKALDDLLYSNKNVVMCAPTGSGKTVIFEIAIVRLLMEVPAPWTNVKIVYMAPIKALCGQRLEDWTEKFEPIGLKCKELTGDTEMDDLLEIQHAHIIMTTPVHTVKDESRGATLEVVVSRMKTVKASLLRTAKDTDVLLPMRFVAVSATIPNADDIAEWLSDGRCPAICIKMDECHRPVKLRKVVLGYPSGSNQTEYKFDLTLNYKVAGVIQTYSDQKPTLVFCATRKGVQLAASILAKDARFFMSTEHKQRLQKTANSIKDGKLRDLVLYGVGFHHAGMEMSDRKIVEGAFTLGDLPVLFTTSTLAMGVNLPAHLVIIKSTMHYVSGMFQEYSETDILQMIGRAGRPQFDSTATAVIMTRLSTKEKYMHMLDGADTIESSLHRHLVEHLNAEITLHTITDVNIALEWIRSTFLYIRTMKNPSYYGFQAGLDRMGIEAKLQELCIKNLNDLSSVGLIRMDDEANFKPTESGKLIASHYIAFETAKLFFSLQGKEILSELITIISTCKEFSDVQLRMSEKRILNTLNKDKNRVTIRFPLEGKIKTREMKVNCLIQAQLGCIPVQEFSLTQDMTKIFRQGIRVTKCLYEFLALQDKKFAAFLNALTLAKCFRCKIWENSSHVSKQLEKIGVSFSNAMVNAGLTSFKKIEDKNPRELELIVNRHPPFGNQIIESVLHLPEYQLSIEQLTRYSSSLAEIVVTVMLTNFERLQKKRTASDFHYVTLVIGDSDNNITFRQKIMDSALTKTGLWKRKVEIKRASLSDELSVNLISSEYVGLDIHQTFRVAYSGTQRLDGNVESNWKAMNTDISKSNTQLSYGCSSLQAVLKTGMRECNHHCKNKEACGHECCKTGVSHKADSKTNSNFSSYLSDLRSRNSVSSAPLVKRLKMQVQSEMATSLHKFAFTPKSSMNTSLRPPTLTAAAQSTSNEPLEDEENCYTDHPPGGAGGLSCMYSGNKDYGSKQSKTITEHQEDLTDTYDDKMWLMETDNVTFELGDDVWDDLDDDCLLVASSSPTTIQVSDLGSSNRSISCNSKTATNCLSSAAQLLETGYNTMDLKCSHFSKNVPQKCAVLRDMGATNYSLHGKITETADDWRHLEKRKRARGMTEGHHHQDFFVNHVTDHGSGSLDEEAQAFIGIFDGIF
ncbi:probable ATP-dependent DNA helicase HFM1 isoform X3 [Hyperolius riggenbachi]|uniref:probable ATP-dependent DNA helicase HFM1 isoform X3 n=1 Tax=Hyperolius riggenbachi TaxID=752182 RepID=UPI0035A2F67B